jgi:hypothetical protein
VLRKEDITKMAGDAIDRQSLLALVVETLTRFPPQEDSDSLRPFRSIGVDYLQGKITHQQFGLLYAKGKTAKQITDGLLEILNARQPRKPVKPGDKGNTCPKKWHLAKQSRRPRRFWNGLR